MHAPSPDLESMPSACVPHPTARSAGGCGLLRRDPARRNPVRSDPARRGPVRPGFLPALALFTLLALTACDGADDRHLFSIDGTGTVAGEAFLDLNRDGVRSGGEGPLADVRIGIVMAGSGDTVAVTTTDSEGRFEVRDLAAGSYELAAGGAILGDSLELTGVQPERIQLAANGSSSASVGISFPVWSIPQARGQPDGSRIYVEGILLNARGNLPDNTVHVWDGQRAIAAPEVAGFTHSVGDSARVLGRVQEVDGRAVLTQGQGFRIAQGDPPEPIGITTQRIRNASDGSSAGALDGALVQVDDAVVSDVRAVPGGVVATASDGSGSGAIQIPNAHLSGAGISQLQPGAVLTVAGILLRSEAASEWELRTRSADDLTAEAQGAVTGRTFFDRNGSGSFDTGDTPLADVRLRLFRTTNLQSPVAEVTSDADGQFQIGPLDVNSYVLEVDETTVPDSLVVRSVAPGTINVPTGGSVDVSVVISHPQVTSAEARQLPEGETVFLQGTALNARSAFGDNSVHVRDDGGALRTLEVDATVLAGDRVRLRGRTARVAGQMVLTGVTPFVQSEGGVPGPAILTTAQARTAAGGSRDADAVRVREVTVTAAEGTSGRWLVTVDDGTGTVVVHVRLATVGMTQEEAQERFQQGARLNINGLLIPEEDTGHWRIHPRTGGDLTTISP